MIRPMRRLAGRTIRSVPWLRRQIYSNIDYQVLTREQAGTQPASGWTGKLTAIRQQRAYEELLAQLHAGTSRIDLEVAAQCVRATGLKQPSIVEIGCGGGYYSEVFEHYFGNGFDYLGIDYSPAMVKLARRRYPRRRFQVGDACRLDLPSASADIAFNGVSLMHILQYREAIAESARVARDYCVFHSVPLFAQRPTTYLRKFAYGALLVEIVFNRDELLRCFESCGLQLQESWTSIPYDVYPVTGEHSSCETFLLRVSRPAQAEGLT